MRRTAHLYIELRSTCAILKRRMAFCCGPECSLGMSEYDGVHLRRCVLSAPGETPMAIMAPDIQIVKRADGRSSVAFAAYRAAAMLYDERTGERFDYSRKSGVIHTEIMAPRPGVGLRPPAALGQC
jgi:hypothetical protein